MQALEHDGALRLLMVRRDLADLPLGIKQTQLQAIHQLKSQLIEQTVEPIREQLRGGEPEDQEKIEKAFDEKVNALTYHKIFDQIEVEDLYFETKTGRQSIPGDVARVHNVYVLARFPLDHLADLRESFVSLLKDADKTELKELGASLSE